MRVHGTAKVALLLCMCDVQLVECNGVSEDICEQLEMLTQSKLQMSSLVEPVVGESPNHGRRKKDDEEEEEEEEKWSEEDMLRIHPCVELINVWRRNYKWLPMLLAWPTLLI